MLTTATALTSWAKAIKRALEAAGHDGVAFFGQAGLDLRSLDDPDARYPIERTTRLWRLAVQATGDPCFGLKVAQYVAPTTFHALGYALVASPTLKHAFERIVRYYRIVSNAAKLELLARGDEYHFRIVTPPAGPQLADEALDAFVAVHVRLCRGLAGAAFAPLRVHLQRPAPADARCFESVLRAPIRFDADTTLLAFDRATFEKPLDGANAELARHNDQVVLKYLARFDRADVRTRVEAALVERLPHGEPSQAKVAAALHLSVRGLQRRLAEEGTTYQELLDATRRELAQSYLRDPAYSIGDVTYLLGFSDTSSFTRAFRRWTGRAPSQYRRA